MAQDAHAMSEDNGESTNHEYGCRPLPSLLDEIADSDPSRVFASIPKGREVQNGFLDINYGQLDRAVSNCAWFLRDEARLSKPFETFTYLGPIDLRYQILCFAVLKVGAEVFLPSPKNTADININLIEQASCEVVVAPKPLPRALAAVLDKKPSLRVAYLPSLDKLLSPDSHPRIPFDKTWEKCRTDPFVVSHTSGSTGNPKLLPLRHGWFTGCDAHRSQAHPDAQQTWAELLTGRRVLSSLPPFHGAGMVISLAKTMYHNFTVVLLHPNVPPTADYIDSMHVHGNIQGSMLPPSILADIARDPQMLERVRRLDFTGFGGGPLPSKEGNMIKARTRLVNNMGITEAGVFACEVVDDEDFNYIRFSPLVGADFRLSEDSLYEMVIVRKEALKRTQPIFITYPELNEWRTRDLYSPHPTKPDLWYYRGRADDVVVFSNGEKLNPLSIEDGVISHPKVAGALVTGQGRFQAALIVEPKVALSSPSEEAHLRHELWTLLQEVDSTIVSHGKIAKDMIIFAKPEKPFLYTAKGTVRRQVTLEMYRDEIEHLYDDIGPEDDNQVCRSSDEESHTHTTVRSIVSEELHMPALKDDSNFLEIGMDSLQATNMARGINRALHEPKLQARTVFSHPSVQDLTALVDCGMPSPITSQPDPIRQMEDTLNQHVVGIPVTTRVPFTRPENLTVILTGSTGSLGGYIFHALVNNPRVERLYCLNRSYDSEQRQFQSLLDKGLSAQTYGKCSWLTCDMSQPCFGLPTSVFKDLLSKTTHIIHNAWDVDFILPLSSFGSHLRGISQLVNFCAHSTYGVHLCFTSSVGVALNWRASSPDDKIPETVLKDWSSSEQMGYAQSKLVAERMLERAHDTANLDVTICRVGQVAGPALREEGVWNPREWLPSLIASSKVLKHVPKTLGPMSNLDWVPIDLCAKLLVELVIGDHAIDTRPKDTPLANGSVAYDDEQNEKEIPYPRDLLQRTKTYWSGLSQKGIGNSTLHDGRTTQEDDPHLPSEKDVLDETALPQPTDMLQRTGTYWTGTDSGNDSSQRDGGDESTEDSALRNRPNRDDDLTERREMLKRTDTYHSGYSLSANKRHTSASQANGRLVNGVVRSRRSSQASAEACKEATEIRSQLKVNHVVNPQTTSWSSLLPTVLRFLPEDTKVVSFIEWVDILKQAASGLDDRFGIVSQDNAAASIPAVKLLSFYEDLATRTRNDLGARMPVFDTERTWNDSMQMRELDRVNEVWMARWMRQWGFESPMTVSP